MKTILSKRDKQIIKASPFLKYLGFVIMLVGIAGVFVGLQKIYIIKTITTRTYDEILTGLSFGIIFYGFFIYDDYRIMAKLKKISDQDITKAD
jgi:hypothetical protein